MPTLLAAIDDEFGLPDGWEGPFIRTALQVNPVPMTGSGDYYVAGVSAGLILLGDMPEFQAKDFVRRRYPLRLVEIEVSQEVYDVAVARLTPRPDPA